jgi:hypothetical protein
MNRDSTVCTIMRLRTERSEDRFPARRRLVLLPNTSQSSLEPTWTVVVSYLGNGYSWLPYLHDHPYAPSTGVSTTVRGAFVKVTNLMAAQAGRRLTCNYYLAVCSMGNGVQFPGWSGQFVILATQLSLAPRFMLSCLVHGQFFHLSCVLFILGLISSALNNSDNGVTEGLWVI